MSYIQNPNPWWLTGGPNTGLGQDTTDGTDTVDITVPGQTSSGVDTSGSSFPSIADLSASAQTPLPSEVVIPGTNYNASLDSSTGLYSTSINGQQAYVAPPQNSAAWAAFLTAMTKAGVQLATIATIQPGTAVLPNGTVVSVPAGQSLASTFGNLFSTPSIGGLSIGTVVIIGFVGIFAFSMLGKR